MIASVVPLKRLPRFSSIFDYAIPHTLENDVLPGQLVIIEFRKKKEFAIILRTSTEHSTEFAYKPIDSIVHPIPIFLTTHLRLLQQLSVLYAVSLATLCKTSLLPLQKRKLTKIILTPEALLPTHSTTPSQSYVLYQTEQEHRALFGNLTESHTTLVLVPEVSKLADIHRFITDTTNSPILIWRSDLSIKEKYDLWLRVRNATEPIIIIGARSALTLPFRRLDRIIMDFEHDEQYKNYDQQPKFHTKDIVALLANLYQCQVTYSSFSPSFDCYYSIVKNSLPCTTGNHTYQSGLLFITDTTSNSIRIIEHTQQTREDRICSIAIEDSIREIAQKQVGDATILVQRKGYATTVICKDCGHIEVSKESGVPMIYRTETRMTHAPYSGERRPLPLTCSSCGSTTLRLQGIGTEKVASFFSDIFKKENINMPIFRIDDNTEHSTFEKLSADTPRLLIGTEKILSYIRHDKTQAYVILDFDRFLAIPEYNSFEHAVHLVDELNYYRSHNSQLLLEVSSGEKNFFRLFKERDRVYRTELSLRQQLGYPPYQSMIKYTVASFSRGSAQTLAHNLRQEIALRLTNRGIPATLSEIYETHPNFEKMKYWCGILLKTNSENVLKIAEIIHPHLPKECIVDIHPLSVLSP